MKITVIVPLAVAITAIAQSISAHELLLTEISSTNLIVTYDGSKIGVDVNYISTDHWGVTIGFASAFSGTPQWTEPEDPSAFNVITLLGPPNQFIVNSDYLDNGTTPLTNGSPFNNFGTDSRDGGSISVTFRDRGDAPTAPDAGSTFFLLFLSLTALFFAGRLRSLRLA